MRAINPLPAWALIVTLLLALLFHLLVYIEVAAAQRLG